ncbi:MAG: hypothetical protein FWD11_07005 [Micrococcales bacterium]|nr:hypothetical protein [Micrococcales bacterium]
MPSTFVARLRVYFREMYPLGRSLFVGYLLCFELYFLTLLTNDRTGFNVGPAEVSVGFTLFAFLLNLRIADDFKDYQTDLTLFPDRPLPSGRTRKSDLVWVLVVLDTVVVGLNVVVVRNHVFFALLVAYGVLMSFWFFQRYRIQRSLVLAVVTHNPVQLVMNTYVISFACARYDIALVGWNNLLILCTLYFPGLIWEIARKVRAPQDETEYVTYSSLFGVRKAVGFIAAVMLLDLVTSSILAYQLYPWAVWTVVAAYAWLVWQCIRFVRNPARGPLVDKIIVYEFAAEGSMTVFIAARLLGLGHVA